jgi:hypothetical protein
LGWAAWLFGGGRRRLCGGLGGGVERGGVDGAPWVGVYGWLVVRPPYGWAEGGYPCGERGYGGGGEAG